MTAKKREFVFMCFGLTFALLIVVGFVAFLIQSPKSVPVNEGVEALIRERQKELIAQGKVDEALELESKLKDVSRLPSKPSEKGADVRDAPAITPEVIEITEREKPSITKKADSLIDSGEKRLSGGSKNSIKISSGVEEAKTSSTISLSNVPSMKNERATDDLSPESQDYDTELKIDELESAAAQGDNRAQAILSICYREGYGVKVDHRKAYSYAKQSAESGDGLGNFALALCYQYAAGSEKNVEKAKEYAASAFGEIEGETTSSDPWVNFATGRILAGGLGIHENHVASFSHYELAVEKNHAPAKHHLAFLLATGTGCDVDIDRAELLYSESAKDGWVPAKVESAFRLLVGAESEEEQKEAFGLISEAALSGSPFALFVLGSNFLLEGVGTERNVSLALQKLQEAGELGFEGAFELLGKIYHHGLYEVAVDGSRATAFFERAVKQGSETARFYLGLQIILNNGDDLVSKSVSDQAKTQILLSVNEHWSLLPSSYWSEKAFEDFPKWKELELAFTEMFRNEGVSLPWEVSRSEDVDQRLVSDTSSEGLILRGPNMLGIQIGDNIENAAAAFNRDHLKTVEGEKLRAVKTPVGGDYVCSTEAGLKGMLERDKARASDQAALEQLLLDQMNLFGGLGGNPSAEYSGAPIIFGDEKGMVIKFVFTPSYLRRAFPNQYSASSQQFLSFLNSKFDLPYLEAEVVETMSLFEGEGFGSRYFGFTEDGVSVEIEADKTIIVRLAE
jgi:TPR repeat protein